MGQVSPAFRQSSRRVVANKIESFCKEKKYILCHRIILLNLKRRLSASAWKKDEQSTVSPRNTVSPKRASVDGAMNSRKNAKLKAFKLLRSIIKRKL